MFKVILSAVVALGLGSFAYADDPAPTGTDSSTTEATKTTTTTTKDTPAMPDHAAMKKDHMKKMADGKDMNKMKHTKKEKKTTETTEPAN